MSTHEHNPNTTLRNTLKKTVLTTSWAMMYPVSRIGRRLYRLGMSLEFLKDWGTFPNPEWFNHELDLVFFEDWRTPHFFERGTYASEVVQGKRVLDLCCGDGSVSALFISPLAKEVLAIDFDPRAIQFAKNRWGKYKNLKFQLADIRKLNLEKNSHDVCLWEAAIEHFTEAEITAVIQNIKNGLAAGGILHGHTIQKQDVLSHHDHEHEFTSTEELKTLLGKHFKNVRVWERKHEDRTNFYFRCSDEKI